MPQTRLDDAVRELDPGSRALLDLSVRRGLADADLAEILGSDTADVQRKREELLERLASQTGRTRAGSAVEAELTTLPAQAWAPGSDVETPKAERRPKAEPMRPEAEPVRPTPAREPPGRRGVVGRGAAAGILLVVLAALAGVLLAVQAGGDREPAGQRAAAPPATGPTVELEPLPGASDQAGASARIEGSGDDARLLVEASGLRGAADRHEVWLFDTVTDAASVGRLGSDGRLSAPLPADLADFPFVDISRERDGDAPHSGASVMRAPTEALTAER